jgi:predicted Fe-Mo cluster-binding NifX family protein
MKIAVTSSGPELKSEVDSRFGRCPFFIIYDVENNQFEAIENSNIRGMGGVGIQSAQMIADKDVKVVITGNCGPNAFRTIDAAGIQLITGASGTVESVIQEYKKGNLKPADHSNVEPHSGLNQK